MRYYAIVKPKHPVFLSFKDADILIIETFVFFSPKIFYKLERGELKKCFHSITRKEFHILWTLCENRYKSFLFSKLIKTLSKKHFELFL